MERGEGHREDVAMLDPLEGLKVTPTPTLVRTPPQLSVGLRRQEIWLKTVRLLRKKGPGGSRLGTKATSSLSPQPLPLIFRQRRTQS
jgi:hypothetical protein